MARKRRNSQPDAIVYLLPAMVVLGGLYYLMTKADAAQPVLDQLNQDGMKGFGGCGCQARQPIRSNRAPFGGF